MGGSRRPAWTARISGRQHLGRHDRAPLAALSGFGWAAARLDDLANWVPARLAALAAAAWAPLVGGTTGNAIDVVRRDAGRHPSPNAGVVEAAFAGALDVQLGGRNAYHGTVEDRGILGTGRPVAVADIDRANRLAAAVGERAGRGGSGSRLATMTILILGGTAEARQLAAASLRTASR